MGNYYCIYNFIDQLNTINKVINNYNYNSDIISGYNLIQQPSALIILTVIDKNSMFDKEREERGEEREGERGREGGRGRGEGIGI